MKFEEKQPEPAKPDLVITFTHDEARKLYIGLPLSSASTNEVIAALNKHLKAFLGY